MRRAIPIFACILVGVLASTAAVAAVPQLINYQGELTSGGSPVTTPTNVIFAIWNNLSMGDSLWSEQQTVTPDGDGRFNILLGSVSTIPDSAFAEPERYLSVKVGTDPEMSPRQQIVSVGYAYRVASVDGATGGSITSKLSIGPGHTNTGQDAFVAGSNNTASGLFSTVGGGYVNEASDQLSTVGGGGYNTSSHVYSTVGGGHSNAASGQGSVVGGGFGNTATGRFSTVGGGRADTAAGEFSTIGGGRSNTAGDTATVAGGDSNAATGNYAAIGGGTANTADAVWTVVSGGINNHAYENGSTIGGGIYNNAGGVCSTVPGGLGNDALGWTSLAAGYLAKALHDGTFVWADSTSAWFESTNINQFLIRAKGGVGIGTNAPVAQLHVQSSDYSGSGTSTGGYFVATGSGTNRGMYATASGGATNWAGYFSGNVNVTGTLSKGGGSFKIDHPLDPENKYLFHSFIESPDMMNVYNGNVILDGSGSAFVELPDYFEALNRDFRYQLTAIGAPGPNLYIAEKISGNRFRIAGGSPAMEVSWQVTGIRQDAFAQANRIPVEELKPTAERGLYLYPEAHGHPRDKGIDYQHSVEMMEREEKTHGMAALATQQSKDKE